MGLILGQPYRIALSVTDKTPGSATFNTLQDPGALVLRMQGPRDRAPTVYTWPNGQLVRDDQGDFHLDWTPLDSGVWVRRWIATAPYAGATEAITFTVDNSPVG